MTDATKLLPCPFCGASNVSVMEGSTFRWRFAVCNKCGAQSGEVRCQTLGDGTKEQWEAQAHQDTIAEWNRRAALSGPTPDAPAGMPDEIDIAFASRDCVDEHIAKLRAFAVAQKERGDEQSNLSLRYHEYWQEEQKRTIAAEAAASAMREDAERLDWCEQYGANIEALESGRRTWGVHTQGRSGDGVGETIRSAIDASRGAEGK